MAVGEFQADEVVVWLLDGVGFNEAEHVEVVVEAQEVDLVLIGDEVQPDVSSVVAVELTGVVAEAADGAAVEDRIVVVLGPPYSFLFSIFALNDVCLIAWRMMGLDSPYSVELYNDRLQTS